MLAQEMFQSSSQAVPTSDQVGSADSPLMTPSVGDNVVSEPGPAESSTLKPKKRVREVWSLRR